MSLFDRNSKKDKKDIIDAYMHCLAEEGYKSCSVSVGAFLSQINSLLPHVASMMKISEHQLKNQIANLNDLKFIKLDNFINGYVEPHNSSWSKYSIKINEGLWMFLLFFPLILLAPLEIRVMEDPSKKEKAKISMDKLALIAEKFMCSYWEEKQDFSHIKEFDLLNYSGMQQNLAARICWNARNFIIAHEFGHVMYNSCPDSIADELYAQLALNRDSYSSYLQELEINDKKKTRAYIKWPEELVSDIIGLKLCMELHESPEDAAMILSSVEFVIITLNLLDKYYQRRHKRDFWQLQYANNYEDNSEMDHPPSSIRLDSIKRFGSAAIEGYSHLNGFGRALEEVGDSLIENIFRQ